MKNKKLVLERLRATRKKMSYLRDGINFDYSNFVSKFEKKCGTTCCIGGWYPAWFPKSGLKWNIVENGLIVLQNNSSVQIDEKLAEYHKINNSIVNALFYGDQLRLKNGGIIPQIGVYASIKVVRKHWDAIISEIERGNI